MSQLHCERIAAVVLLICHEIHNVTQQLRHLPAIHSQHRHIMCVRNVTAQSLLHSWGTVTCLTNTGNSINQTYLRAWCSTNLTCSDNDLLQLQSTTSYLVYNKYSVCKSHSLTNNKVTLWLNNTGAHSNQYYELLWSASTFKKCLSVPCNFQLDSLDKTIRWVRPQDSND